MDEIFKGPLAFATLCLFLLATVVLTFEKSKCKAVIDLLKIVGTAIAAAGWCWVFVALSRASFSG